MKDPISPELIEKYLTYSLPETEQAEFARKLESDSALAAQVSDYRLAMKSAEHYGKIKLKERLGKIMTETKAEQAKWHNNQWMRIAAAVLIFLAAGSPFLFNHFNQGIDYQQIYTENFNLYPNVLNQRSDDVQKNVMLTEAMSYYSDKDFVNAFALLDELSKKQDSLAATVTFYKGICLLGAGKDEEAAEVFSNILSNPDESYKNPARWYLALTFIKSGKQAEAEALLKEISVEKTYNYLKAEKILEELE